jgi:thioredoxin-related protein
MKTMRRAALIAGIAIAGATLVLVQQRNAKGDSHLEYDDAMAKAKAEGKCLFLAFTGSDWCDWCIRFDHEIYSQAAFKAFAASNLVTLVVDFPRGTSGQSREQVARNEQLARRFGVQGFPTVFIICPEGNAIARTGYREGGPEVYIEHVRNLIAGSK